MMMQVVVCHRLFSYSLVIKNFDCIAEQNNE